MTGDEAAHGRFLSRVLSGLPDDVCVTDADGAVRFTNHRTTPIADATGSVGLTGLARVHPQDRQLAQAAADALLAAAGATATGTFRVRIDGQWHWLETTGVNLLDDPEVAGLVLISRVVDDRVALLRRLERLLQAQQLVAELGVLVLRGPAGLDDLLEEVLGRTAALLGSDSLALLERDGAGDLRVTRHLAARPLPAGTVLARTGADLTVPGAQGRPLVAKLRERGLRCGLEAVLQGPAGPLGLLVADADGGCEHDSWQAQLLQAVANVLAGARQRELREGEALVRALHDPLTGLPTRPVLLDRLEHALRRSVRDGSEVAVLLVDLDGFKQVNDRYGHAAGDAVLAQLGPRLRACVRPGDTAARLGGDEFVVLCEDVRQPEGVLAVRDRLREACREPLLLPDGSPVVLSGSVGAAFSGAAGRDAAALLHAADLAMYRDKRAH